MYTVLRFSFPGDTAAIDELMSAWRLIAPDLEKGPDRVKGRISCTAASNATWASHLAELDAFLESHQPTLVWSANRGIGLELDVAIYSEDVNGIVGSFDFTPGLLRRFADEKINLMISVYK